MDSPRSPDSLSRLLASWRVNAPRDPRFRTAVRERLLARAANPSWIGYARRHAAGVGTALVLAVVAGAMTGHERARARVAADSARLAAAYVEGLDARAMSGR
jgi:hypothetical protein